MKALLILGGLALALSLSRAARTGGSGAAIVPSTAAPATPEAPQTIPLAHDRMPVTGAPVVGFQPVAPAYIGAAGIRAQRRSSRGKIATGGRKW